MGFEYIWTTNFSFMNTKALLLISFAILSFYPACKETEDPPKEEEENFSPEENQFTWDGKKFDLSKFNWGSESFNSSTGLYKFDVIMNDANEDHELYFEDLYTLQSNYSGSYEYVNSADTSQFDWFGLDINKSGNTSDTVFHSSNSKWVSGHIDIEYKGDYIVFSFEMTYDDSRVLTGYYAELD